MFAQKLNKVEYVVFTLQMDQTFEFPDLFSKYDRNR